MGAVLSIAAVLTFVQLIIGFWFLAKVYEVSIGWFFLLLLLGFASIFAASPLLTAIQLVAILVFAVRHWQAVRTPCLLLLATITVDTVIHFQARRTLAEQAKQAPAGQVR